MGIYRTNNPNEYAEVDGIVIDEQAPSPNVQGVGTGTVLLLGQLQRGPDIVQSVGSIKSFHKLYGKSNYLGNKQLKNKKFSRLKIKRVIASDAVLATISLSNVTVPSIKIDAKSKGVYGNDITVTVEAGSVSGKKYTIKGNDSDNLEFFPDEVYDNVLIASVAADDTFGASKLVDVSVLDVTSEVADAAATNLATGADGTIADTDYETALQSVQTERIANVIILDENNATRNEYLETHAALTQDRIVICSGAESEDVAAAIASAALLRQPDGRVIYAYNWVGSLINGLEEFTNPASWLASIISQTHPKTDPASADNSGLLFGVTSLKNPELDRADYVLLMEGGVCAFEDDEDIGFKVKSGIVTQIANSSKLTILRRRMTDYLTNSIGIFLKLYQNGDNSLLQRTAAKGAILSFVQSQENLGILPRDSEVQSGNAKIVDIDSENDDDSIAAGLFIIVYKQRIFSSMRFIVLKSEIGESVVVTEGE